MAEEETGLDPSETTPDNEVDADAPENTDEESETTPEDAESEAAEGEPETDDEEETSEKEKPDPRQRKIAELSYRERELKRQNARLMAMLEKSQQTPKSDVQPPKIEDFDTFDEYLDARDEYKAKLSGTKAETETDRTDIDLASFEISRDELYANGIARHADFVDVVSAEDVDISIPMANAIYEIDDVDLQVDTAYYLGTNPQEAAKIARMTPVRQIAEVAKISARIESKRSKPSRKPSKAPAPVKPVGGKKTTSDEIQPQEDVASFIKKRNKQLGRG